MQRDLRSILSDWPFDPGKVNARIIRGTDGKRRVQLRLDLGILQMEIDGRPDGERPAGQESWFEHYKAAYARHCEAGHDPEIFRLDVSDCARLHREAVQYYHRYLSLFQLRDWRRVIRDTERNLDLFDFVSRFAANDDLTWMLEQLTPYAMMTGVRARAMQLIDKGRQAEAIDCVTEGIRHIEDFLRDEDEDDDASVESAELRFLRDWLDELQRGGPLSVRERIQRELCEAIAKEDYERAAQLRDQLAHLAETSDSVRADD